MTSCFPFAEIHKNYGIDKHNNLIKIMCTLLALLPVENVIHYLPSVDMHSASMYYVNFVLVRKQNVKIHK